MCGICGVANHARGAEATGSMIAAMDHRGPDDSGIHTQGRYSLGMTRLAIQDLSAAGHQPMSAADGKIWMVYNGEMYNTREQREVLEQRGYTFRSHSDTEVILKLYAEFGTACFARIRGIFAIAIYDFREGSETPKVVLARDPLGVKPLLLARGSGGAFVFGSEMKAVLASGLVDRVVDGDALRGLFENGSVFQPKTLVRDVRMIEPAEMLTIENGKITAERYYTLRDDLFPELAKADYREQVAVLGDALRETVRAQLVSDAPIGAFLSGGVDSATLCALMAAEAGQGIRTYSVGFGSELRSIDETELASEFARHIGAQHERFQVDADLIRDDLMEIVGGLDQPSVDGLNTYFVSKIASRDVKVAISGTGADDLFMGYPWHADMLRRAPAPSGFLEDYAERSGNFHATFNAKEVDQILSDGLRRSAARVALEEYRSIDELPESDAVARLTALTLRGYTKNQLLRDIDAMSMAHSLEVRVPYLDPTIINLGLSLPAGAKIAGTPSGSPMRLSYKDSGIKRILIDIARPLLPKGFDEVPKRGFGIPLTPWLNGPLKDIVGDILRPDRVQATGLLNPRVMVNLQKSLAEGRTISGWRLWLLMNVQLWAEMTGVEPEQRAA
ncbi:asparagine synthase (glutamine-hydrolyzing) [Nisaea acidiphila]|uniref:asparagine synthase (glutamine-hydrolyzing) n=1 Tax=Nisaea acidiphila TaxID=1862145 RepID=A0A9J7ASJ5_9PROT|nr:asparagine synthase (glutamine-hydrolyzing) [Nisaea acidiphila]UUX48317.1 asparagine synthase (glutamine-hydrolyzing) [Nisaea acidiphila]